MPSKITLLGGGEQSVFKMGNIFESAVPNGIYQMQGNNITRYIKVNNSLVISYNKEYESATALSKDTVDVFRNSILEPTNEVFTLEVY